MHMPTRVSDEERYREIRTVTLVGALVDLLLGVAKIVVGIIGHSQALLADGIHSLSDLATDFMVLFAAKHASREADPSHPYGHARIETMMTVALGAALILVGFGIAWDAISRLFTPERLLRPGWLAMAVAIISILSKEAIYHYTMFAAKKYRSNLLRANAWHSRSDALSSIVVVIGVAGSMMGLEYLDAIAAVIVALMIAHIGWKLSWSSVRELVDTALDEEKVEQIRDTIASVSGVKDLHFLRTRRMGPDALVDVHIQVSPKLSVSEGHQVSERVRQRVIDSIDEVSDVLVHIDPEDDQEAQTCEDLPLRKELLEKAGQTWKDIAGSEHIRHVTLHYLDGQVHMEVQIPLDSVPDLEQARALSGRLRERLAQMPEVGEVQVHFV